MIRDQALTSSGLLVRTLGGPSVMPYQPPGLWEEVSYNAEASYEVDDGPGRYRRSLYTYHKRQAPPPSLLVFDGPTREKCSLKRPRTNTPLQALVLLNDPTYVEAARAVARRVLKQGGDDRERVTVAVRAVLSREPTATEIATLSRFVGEQRSRFAENAEAASRLLARHLLAGSDPEPQGAGEVSAWMLLVHTLFNLDEAITRR
jgi:hypothetical protein